jgi:hypothetical protein
VADRTNQAASARDALRDHQYQFALDCVRAGVREFAEGKSDALGGITYLIGTDAYGNLAAAFEAEDVIDLMEKAADRIVKLGGEQAERLRPRFRVEAHRQTLEAMKWLRTRVSDAIEIDLPTLEGLAIGAKVTKAKSRLGWMEKVGSLHLDGQVVRWGPAPASVPEPAPTSSVPPFKSYYSTEADMAAEQRAFYRKFASRFAAGETVELEGNWSYAFALIDQLTRDLGDDLYALGEMFSRFERDYPDSTVESFCRSWRADTHFLRNDWQGGWDALMPAISMDVYATLAPLVADSRLRTATVEGWMPKKQMLTSSLRGRSDEVNAVLQDLLDAAHEELGRSLVSDLWVRLIDERPEGSKGPAVADEFGGFITQEKIDSYLEYWDRHLYDRPKAAFQRAESRAVDWPVRFCATYWFDEIARARLQSLYRDAENIVRQSTGMPAVGEGWISEVTLLRALREAFSDERVVHQGRPSWLGQQSLDIFFPEHNIGVEYQGAQHSGPVSLFGGQLGFEQQVRRDARKRKLCEENDCRLIEVHPGYELQEVVSRIDEFIDR